MLLEVSEPLLFDPTDHRSAFEFAKDLSEENYKMISNYIYECSLHNYGVAYEAIRGMSTLLDKDPTEVGIKSLNGHMRDVQAHKDNLARLTVDAHKDLHDWENLLFYVNKFYVHNKNQLFTQDWVKELKNQDLRVAAVDSKVVHIVNLKDYCELRISTIKNFLKQCDVVFNNLKSTNDNISRQITVIQQQIDIAEIKRK